MCARNHQARLLAEVEAHHHLWLNFAARHTWRPDVPRLADLAELSRVELEEAGIEGIWGDEEF